MQSYNKKLLYNDDLAGENARFNEELSELTAANADKVVLPLGRPSAILRSAGVEDKPMKLYGNKVMKKMRKHGFALEELQDLPLAVADPIAVFDNYQEKGNRSILTELKTTQGNFLVALNVGKSRDIEFNVISSVFGKGKENIVSWINSGYATYINKEKALVWLGHSRAHHGPPAKEELLGSSNEQYYPAPIAETPSRSRLSAANVVENFENPPLHREKVEEGELNNANSIDSGAQSGNLRSLEGKDSKGLRGLNEAGETDGGLQTDDRFRDDEAFSDEELRIINMAKDAGTYMKAPNGETTNLSARQWVQVRTAAFKKWFGDWEKVSRIEKLKRSKPVHITGKEIEPSEDLKEYKKNAFNYGKKLQGEYTNNDTGDKVYLQRGRKNGGINEVLQHDYKDVEHLQSIAAIPQIIENSIYIDSSANQDKEKNPSVKEYQYYVCGLKIGDTDYTVRSVIAVDNNGHRYYDHKLTNIEKGKLLDQINDQAVNNNGFDSTSGTKPTTDNVVGKDSKSSSSVQGKEKKVEEGRVAGKDSKVVKASKVLKESSGKAVVGGDGSQTGSQRSLGNEDVRFRLGDSAESFEDRQRAAVANRGTVMPGLNAASVEVVEAEPNAFANFAEARRWAKEHIERTYDNEETGGKGSIRISHTAVGKFLSEKAINKSSDMESHLVVLKVLPTIIRTGIEAEEHPDYRKIDDRRNADVVNPDVLIHRIYGATIIDGKIYRVKVTLKEYAEDGPNRAYSYETTKIELLAGLNEEAKTSSRYSYSSIPVAKLLKGVEKSYDKGKKLLAESEKIQALIDQQRTNLADVDYLDLDSSAKIIERFENPKIEGENISDDSVLFRDGEDLDRSWREEYDAMLGMNAFKFSEAWGDYMASMKKLQKLVAKASGKKVAEFEDVWTKENHLSSKNKAEAEYYGKNFYEPVVKAVKALVKMHGER